MQPLLQQALPGVHFEGEPIDLWTKGRLMSFAGFRTREALEFAIHLHNLEVAELIWGDRENG